MSAVGLRVLPALREDLRLHAAPVSRTGAPRWVIFDPVRHRYFQIGLEAFELLARWSAGTVDALVARMQAELGRTVSPRDLEPLLRFLVANGLTREPLTGGWRALYQQSQSGRRTWAGWLITNYLFTRIPLFRPQRFLAATAWLAAPFFTVPVIALVALLGILGLYLVSRQWDEFSHTFVELLSFEGLLFYALVMVGVKVLHELGHAYAAFRCGCRVPTMGIALLVLYPVLYTDVSDAWRVVRRRDRLLIDASGMLTELLVAALATCAWAFLPEGVPRDICFVLATTGWVLSLAINANPFLRFDGYYFLADLLEVENLGPRSFALGRWWLRERLFALDEPAPETLPAGLRRTLIVYAYCTWIYRLVLFIGIALLVYALFFKVLGVVLFVVEILWLVARPIGSELRVWWELRERIMRSRRTCLSLLGLAALFALALVPWRATVVAPAVLQASTEAQVYPPRPAQIAELLVRAGQSVDQGQLLLRLTAPSIEYDLAQARRRAALIEMRLARRTVDARDLEQTIVLERELERERETVAGFDAMLSALAVRAPVSGIVAALDDGIHQGAWVARDTRLAHLVDKARSEVLAALSEHALIRIQRGADALFVPDDIQAPAVALSLVDIEPGARSTLETDYFSSAYGGRVDVRVDARGAHVPSNALFVARLEPVAQADQTQSAMTLVRALRGVVHIDAEPESFARAAWRRIVTVFIRESAA